MERFHISLGSEARATLLALSFIRGQAASAVIRDLLEEAARHHAGDIKAYRALRASVDCNRRAQAKDLSDAE